MWQIDRRLERGEGLSERDLVDLIIATLRLDPSERDGRRAAAADRLVGLLSRHTAEDGLAMDELQWAADAATLLGAQQDATLAEVRFVWSASFEGFPLVISDACRERSESDNGRLRC